MIVLGRRSAELASFCGTVTEAGRHENPHGIPAENRPILLCRDLKVNLPEVWPRLKAWD